MAERDPSDAFEAGQAVRRRVLGEAHVARASAEASEFDRRFQKLIAEGAWGSVWSHDAFTLRERSIVTIALLAALGHEAELAMHLRATRNTGASEADVAEALLHVAIYAGVPAANSAYRIAKSTFARMAEEQASGAEGEAGAS